MAYSVKYIGGKYLELIQEEWISLEVGEEMTLFQSYKWYQMLARQYVPTDTEYFESIYALVKSDGQPCMIAPLWIVKKSFRFVNQKGIYLLGRNSFSDYLNFIYLYFDECAFDFLLNDLSRKYDMSLYVFENLRENTSLYRHILEKYEVRKNKDYPCVGLDLPSSVDDYHNMLSKNSRQNLRTANNRLKKNKKILKYDFDDKLTDPNRCIALRESKLVAKYARVPLYVKYKYRILNRLRYHFPIVIPILDYSESKVMTAYDEEGYLRAFFNYGYDVSGTRVRVMAAGTDLDFAYYSPGMLLMYNFILKSIVDGKIKEIDFTRGDEKYKFSLGGQLRLNRTLKFKMK